MPPSSSISPVHNPWLRPKHSNERDQLFTTRSTAKADTESSVLGQDYHHAYFEQKEPGQPQRPQQDCGLGPPGDSTRAQKPTQVPMVGRKQQRGESKEREPGADSSCWPEKPQ